MQGMAKELNGSEASIRRVVKNKLKARTQKFLQADCLKAKRLKDVRKSLQIL
jgi:hypothetical protein